MRLRAGSSVQMGADISVFTCMHAYCNWPICGYVIYTNLLSVPVQATTAPMY